MMTAIGSILSDQVVTALALTLFHSLWEGVLLALVTTGFVYFFRSGRPLFRYSAYYTLLLIMPVMFAVTFFIVYDNQEVSVPPSVHPVSSTQALVSTSSLTNSAISHPVNLASPHWLKIPVDFIENYANWMVLMWFAGFLFFLVKFSGSLWMVYRLKNKSLYAVPEYWESRLRVLAQSIGVKGKIKLAESALAHIPITIGYLKPVILVPVGTISGVPPQQLEAILLHEIAHIYRKDYILNILQCIVEMLFFYHPVVWWLSGLIRDEREHICDDIALSINNDQLNYIKALTLMEEMNVKSPVIASAFTGSRKKLLGRVKRLIKPTRAKINPGAGITATMLLISLVFVISLTAFSFFPDSYDLTGRESGERFYNILPSGVLKSTSSMSEEIKPVPAGAIPETAAGEPDTIIATSKSGKVTIKVYTDTVDNDDQREIKVFVEALEEQLNEFDNQKKEIEEQVIVLKSMKDQVDSITKTIVIRSGDSIRVITRDSTFILPEGFDTTFSSGEGFQLFGFEVPDIPEFPESPEMPDLRYYYFDDQQIEAGRQFERALREQERKMKDFEWQQRKMERTNPDMPIIIDDPSRINHEWKWVEGAPVPEMNPVEKIIRQELRDDGLISGWKKYVVEIGPKAMYLNGEKQPKEIFRKYRKLVESLDQNVQENNSTFKIIF
ncbi:MAG TPA: M56 family metallopeptidase [Bacteroidales bacterium]|nr:M56 family metallopeptidase [Bacteroidales bacterium]